MHAVCQVKYETTATLIIYKVFVLLQLQEPQYDSRQFLTNPLNYSLISAL